MANDKITSFPKLMGALDKLLWGEAPDSLADDVYRLIRELKASVRTRRDEWKKIDASVKWHYSKKREHQGRILELEHLLEGEEAT